MDAKEKEDLRVVLMDEVRDAVYEHLLNIRCILNKFSGKSGKHSQKQTFAFDWGGGKTGLEFLKAAVWCGQMKDFALDIHMIDLKGNLVRKKLEEECPELFAERAGYNIDIHKANIFSNKTEDYLNTLPDISYCVVCLGDDEDNIRAAMWIKKYYYMRKNHSQPLICAYIKSSKKRETVWNLYEKTRKGDRLYYEIIPFGSRGMCFGDHSDAAFIWNIWDLAYRLIIVE